MRFTLLALAAVALAAVTGCGSSSPPSADAAYVVNFDNGTSGTCSENTNVTDMLGSVSETSIQQRVTDGQVAPNEMGNLASVTCSVTGGSGGFTVNGSASTNTGNTNLTIGIPMITTSASKTSPATGSVTFSTVQLAGETWSSPDAMPCNFYFYPGTGESVASGKIWVAFTCPQISEVGGMANDTCALTESFVAFENCATM